MKAQKRTRERTVTAQPKALRDELPAENPEEGLSIEPEQMGQSFLRYATEQGPTGREELPELRADGAPASDEADLGGHFSADASVWENTEALVREHGNDIDEITEEAAPPYADSEEDEGQRRGVTEVDLTANVIDEASLFDEESDVLGETVPKDSRTDDTGPGRRARDDDDDD